MKLAFLIQDPGLGGLASMHDRLEEALEADGHTVDRCIVQEEPVIEHVRDGGYDVVHLFFSPFLTPTFFLKLLWFNQRSDATVLVNYYNIKPENMFRRLMKRFWLPHLCDTVVLPSENMEQFYQETIGISNTATLRPIINDKFFDIESSGGKIVHFGHARPDKGIDQLMGLASKKEPIHCYFIQDDETVFERFPKMKERVEDDKIILHEELPEKALSEAKLAVFPYHNLNKTVDMPLALLESLAAGVPVLTSNIEPLNKYLPNEYIVDDWSAISLDKNYQRSLCEETLSRMEIKKKDILSLYEKIIHE